jgi:hypothetical protein
VRTLLTHQQPPPTFLQVRDALALEELTWGHYPPASTASSPRALVAAPPPSSASPSASLHGAPPPGPSKGGLPRGALWPTISHPWTGRISMWPHQGQGGGPRPPHQPAAMVMSAASYAPNWTPPPPPNSSWPGGGGVGIRLPWRSPSAPSGSPTRVPLTTLLLMRVSFLLSDLLTPLVLPSWSVMDPVFRSLLWVLLPVLFVSLMSLLLLRWFIIFFLFVNLQLTILVPWSLTLLVFL